MFEKITKTLSGLAFIKYINSLIDYVNTSDIDATRIKGQLDISNIPPAGLDNVIKVDTVTDMLALTVDDVQNGDTVMIIGVTPPVQYQVVDDTKLGTMDAFQEYAAGTATKALADINGNNIHTTYGKLAGNNTWTGNNYWNGSAIFNANLNIRGSATTPGDSSIYLWLGLKPEGSEQTPSIARNKQGELVMYAADYRHCYLRSGIQTCFASVYKSDGTVEFSSLNNTPWGKYTSANGLELTVHKTPTVNNDVPNKKYVDDSIASGTALQTKTIYSYSLGISAGNTIAQLKAAIISKVEKLLPNTGYVGFICHFSCSSSWIQAWNNGNNNFVLEDGAVWNVQILHILKNSVGNYYFSARISTYEDKQVYSVRYTNGIWGNVYQHAFLTDVTSATADLLSSNNTWTGSNTYNSNIVVKANGTAEVVEGSVYLGRSSKTNQARITGDATGNLYLTNSEDGYTYINNGSNSVAYFGNATIKFYKPTYITNGSSAGSSATLYLGVKPTNETVQARISTDNLGGLFYHASTNQPHVFRIGTNNNVFVIRDDDKKVTFSSNNIPFATVTHDGVAKWLGNANTATKLQTARTINGVSFDGTANITIADSTKLPIAGGTMTGDLTLKGNPTADLMAATKKYVDDSVASAGGGDVLAAGNNSFTGANTFQNLVTMVGGVVFTSGTTTLAWKNATQIVATINASTYTGNSATATKLATARTITANLASSTAGSFDGSANITVGVTGTLPIANGGTGATTAAAARTALGCAPAYTYSTTDLTAGSSALTTGTLYIVYE